MSSLSKKKIEELFAKLNTELEKRKERGELYLVGGAVMCLVYQAREATKDVDCFFKPTRAMREAAAAVADEEDLPKDWINDAVKGFLSDDGQFDSYLSLSNLKVYVAQAEYLLAMKALSMRIGREFQDEADVVYLLRYLNIADYETAKGVISKYYPLKRFPQKTLYALEEILGGK